MKNTLIPAIAATISIALSACALEAADVAALAQSTISSPVEYTDRSEITNLRDVPPSSDKTYAEILVSEIREYGAAVLQFELSDKYPPDFELTEIDFIDEPQYLNPGEVSTAYAVLDAGSKKTGEISIKLHIFETAKDAQKAWLESLKWYAIMHLPPADAFGVVVGDVAVGATSDLNYVRGNIQVIIGRIFSSEEEISVVEIAQEIDAQIIAAIEKAECGGV